MVAFFSFSFLSGRLSLYYVPLAASAQPEGDRLRLRALLAARDGSRVAGAEAEAPATQAAALGASVAEALLRDGGAEILEELRREAAE